MATATRTHRAKAAHTKVLGLELTQDDVHQLEREKSLSLSDRSLSEMASFLQELHKKLAAAGKNLTWGELVSYSRSGKCPGIELIAIDENCGLYWRFPMTWEECCRE
jgi:hypothetical protein